ncbi:MAG: hypothetical protein DRP12_00730 [Candidatus Aenigmatarchaeota archaeon]|nr:MAG: hypothetical protein DRP12_00730 [Candidatus Aenigmarchaeota archaeon]
MNGIGPEELKKLEELKQEVLRKTLTREAAERLGRVRIANPQLAAEVELYLIELYQAGRIRQPISEEKLKEILKLLSEKREFRIRRV